MLKRHTEQIRCKGEFPCLSWTLTSSAGFLHFERYFFRAAWSGLVPRKVIILGAAGCEGFGSIFCEPADSNFPLSPFGLKNPANPPPALVSVRSFLLFSELGMMAEFLRSLSGGGAKVWEVARAGPLKKNN